MNQQDPRDLAFIEPKPKVAGLTLRPFSAGTVTLCRALNLTMVTGGGEPLPPELQQQQLVTLLFIQSQPIESVKEAVKVARSDYQKFLDDFILPFELSLPMQALPQIVAELTAACAAAAEAEFDVVGSGKPSDPNS